LLKHLPQPAERVVAHINLDGLNVGDSRPEILQIGRGKSNLDEVIDALATAQKRYVIADTRPTRGIFYRSESVIFARAGIPVLFVAPPDLDGYLATDYLQGSDIFRESWTFTGGALDCALLYQVALWVGSARTLPQVASSDEFAARASAPASGASR
jgi:Zn-dependent M28 family amino/carboxypeptidase